MRRGSVPGEGAVREVAAFLLDRDGFAAVPATTLVSAFVEPADAAAASAASPAAVRPLREQKVGSLQQFVEAAGDCEERGVSDFPAAEVHKIAVLDLRLGNTDRNGGNILAQQVGRRRSGRPAAADLPGCRSCCWQRAGRVAAAVPPPRMPAPHTLVPARCPQASDGSWKLIPIDHAYCLPTCFDDLSFEW
jgi:hypothetical protein